ncbi:carotenoid 1,2-hydratase [Glaciecola sp. MH2013]|nr:carotenoid 1,2-hydratase [Glaciecola sp. MH2013]
MSFNFKTLCFLAIVLIVSVLILVNTKSSPKALDGNASEATNSQSTALFGRSFQSSDNNPMTAGKKADPNYTITFPKDHGSHNDFDIEWWYLTANLKDEKGKDYDLQWTLFRFKNMMNHEPNSSWANEHSYMAHASVHSGEHHWFSEKFARGGTGIAAASSSDDIKDVFSLFIDDWQWRNSQESFALLPAQLNFNVNLVKQDVARKAVSNEVPSTLSLTLALENKGPFVLQGEQGYSIKSGNAQHASHYYSAPFIEIEGRITPVFNDSESTRSSDLLPMKVQGKAWFDQEWTSQLLDEETLGWDWLSLHLDNGEKIMAFRMRLASQEDYITGTLISPTGKAKHLTPSDLSLEPVEHIIVGSKSFPLVWRLLIPDENINLMIQAKKEDQYNPALLPYYEGGVLVSGSESGEGFLELTGY